MININFDNPYLLLLIIPLAALVLVPYFIAIRKENKSRASTIALAVHLAIVLLAVLAVAGMSNVTVITKTEVYVVADISYSADKSLDLVDEYISDIEKNLPKNSEMGVVTFGKNYRLHTPIGEEITSVKESRINRSATDLLSALKYTGTLFSDDSIKRIVVITDGMFTDPDSAGSLVRTIADLKSNGVYVDAVYLDSSLSEDDKEIQLSSVDFKPDAYSNSEMTADVLIESTFDTEVIVKLMKNGVLYKEKPVKLISGYNIVNFDLYTEEEGEYDYEVNFTSREDSSPNNNVLRFTQTVSSDLKILLVTGESSDVRIVRYLYGDKAEIDSYIQPPSAGPNQFPTSFHVPFTVEDLCSYDEIILSNVDVRSIANCDTFISSLDTVVSRFGKTLITVGNNKIQNNDDNSLRALEDLLPVRFGNNDADPKLYTLVIDCSRSMVYERAFFFEIAKKSAEYIINMLGENDAFSIITFSGEVYTTIQPPLMATDENKAKAAHIVRNLGVEQGTMIGSALGAAYDIMSGLGYDEKQLMLISDGLSFASDSSLVDDPVENAKKLNAANITVSTLNPGNIIDEGKVGEKVMKEIANAGGGKYTLCESEEKFEEIMFNEIADEITHSEIIGTADVIVNRANDKVLEGVESLSSINGYVYAKKKASADTVLSTIYTKAGGGTVEVPIYASWSYGTGCVATLTTALGGEWVSGWQSGDGLDFLKNIVYTNVPEHRIDHPYTVDVQFDGRYSYIEIIPAVINPDATMSVRVIFPDGSEANELLTFDSNRYFYKVETGAVGKYTVKTTYNWLTKSYDSENVYTISYSPEYDSFAACSPAPLYAIMRNNGNVYENSDVNFTIEDGKVATYVLKFTVPFLAVATALYVIDTIIRKLQWADIVSLFKKKSRRYENE